MGAVVKDKWKLEALLGAGGMACVYSAMHRNGNRVAIKVLHPELCAVPMIVTRFLREGYLANRVGHPGAVRVLDDDRTEDGAVFLVMELLEGHSLERYTKVGRERLPRANVLRLVSETLDVLAAAHAKGIVHRDIKPANLFLTTEGSIKVLDFGIARLVETSGDAALTQTGASIGTPAFMPPEQARGRWDEVDARTDVWAVGATAFSLLIGDRPRRAETTQEELLLAMTQPLVPLASVLPNVPPEVAAVVDRAVSYDRNARWPDAIAMRDAVANLLANPANLEPSIPWPGVPTASAPPAIGAGGTVVVGDPALTTGRPLASHPLASQAPGPRKTLLVAMIAAVITLGILGAGVIVVGRGTGGTKGKAAAGGGVTASASATAPASDSTPAPESALASATAPATESAPASASASALAPVPTLAPAPSLAPAHAPAPTPAPSSSHHPSAGHSPAPNPF
ncbi:MAG TPA: serine/threonine-protein kinase, partial [Polyangiaceae bacterium]